MLKQIRIEYSEASSPKDKGDFLEDLMRMLLERQRYTVSQRIRYTGTEIDLLCAHRDRRDDTALVECKARLQIVADDLKNFAFDLLVSKKARHGYFVHTSEMQQNAGGIAAELQRDHSDKLTFMGPDKLMELLKEAEAIREPPPLCQSVLIPTKLILLYTPSFKAWVHVLAQAASPSHYSVCSADSSLLDTSQGNVILEMLGEELRDLDLIPWEEPYTSTHSARQPEPVAPVQESSEWTDLRPVGAKYFVGRDELTAALYRFVRAPLDDPGASRVFFIEGKSGWGKSSVIAHLRARASNKRNRNTLFVSAVDSRSANTSAFVGSAVENLLTSAATAGFLPKELAAAIRFPSWFDLLADPNLEPLFGWLRDNGRILVLVFDQFEDVFRKAELFRAFHKLMMDISSRGENLLLGFSWKSEVSIPMDNPAYSLWQQARETAAAFSIEKFGSSEVERVISQLQQQSGQTIPPPLRRRLREGSQGFPWLTKKLATHCYFELQKGLSADGLIDQELNVRALFDRDREALTPEETRGLKVVAQRGYDGDAFDVAEVDEKVSEAVIDRLLSRRLIVRTGGKYSVYWDIFRDYVVEGTPPRLEESFLLRQSPGPCFEALRVLLRKSRTRLEDVCASLKVTEGTALNLLRELRNVGAVSVRGDRFVVRADIGSEESFRNFMKKRLDKHIVVRLLRDQPGSLGQAHLVEALRLGYSSFSFSEKTWETYADFFVAWIRDCQLGIASRMKTEVSRRKGRKGDEALYTPQTRPERLLEYLRGLPKDGKNLRGQKEHGKQLYDLKALGFLTYTRSVVTLTGLGNRAAGSRGSIAARLLAAAAAGKPRIALAVKAEASHLKDPSVSFEDGIAELLEDIQSPSYRNVTRHVLRAWARFISETI